MSNEIIDLEDNEEVIEESLEEIIEEIDYTDITKTYRNKLINSKIFLKKTRSTTCF